MIPSLTPAGGWYYVIVGRKGKAGLFNTRKSAEAATGYHSKAKRREAVSLYLEDTTPGPR